MRTRANDWGNPQTGEIKYGIDVFAPAQAVVDSLRAAVAAFDWRTATAAQVHTVASALGLTPPQGGAS